MAPTDLNKTTPAAPGGKTNVVFQLDASGGQRKISAYVDTVKEGQLALTDVTTADADTSKHGLLPKLSGDDTDYLAGDGTFKQPLLGELADVDLGSADDGDVLTFDEGSSKWKASASTGGGSGGVPAGSPVVIGVPQGGANTNWSDFTLQVRIPHSALLSCPNTWKFRMVFSAGTAVHFQAAAIKRTLKNSLAVVDTTNITMGGSMPYTFSFGATASTSAPIYFDSDEISLPIDADHDYWIYLYFDSGSPNSSVGFNQNTSAIGGNIYGGLAAADASGNALSDTTVPVNGALSATNVFLVTQVLAT